ncbi:MAG: PD-(D/E)XK nuclease family protein [Actinomycetales bacterium]
MTSSVLDRILGASPGWVDVPAPAGASPPGPRAGLSASLSPSRAADFTSCPRLYSFRNVERLPEPPNPAALRGTLVHAILEGLFDLPAAERTLAAATELLAPTWEHLKTVDSQAGDLFASSPPASAESGTEGDADAVPQARAPDVPVPDDAVPAEPEGAVPAEPEGAVSAEPEGAARAGAPGPTAAEAAFIDSAAGLLERYFQLEDPRRYEPVGRELSLQTALTDESGSLVLRGIIDRVDESLDGRIRVVDYKTGRSPAPGRERFALNQLRFYALMWWREHGVIPAALRLIYLGDGVVIDYQPTATEIEATEHRLQALALTVRTAHENHDFPAVPGPRCRWCAFTDRCEPGADWLARRSAQANGQPVPRVPPPAAV